MIDEMNLTPIHKNATKNNLQNQKIRYLVESLDLLLSELQLMDNNEFSRFLIVMHNSVDLNNPIYY
jgi:hypothetical protein